MSDDADNYPPPPSADTPVNESGVYVAPTKNNETKQDAADVQPAKRAETDYNESMGVRFLKVLRMSTMFKVQRPNKRRSAHNEDLVMFGLITKDHYETVMTVVGYVYSSHIY